MLCNIIKVEDDVHSEEEAVGEDDIKQFKVLTK